MEDDLVVKLEKEFSDRRPFKDFRDFHFFPEKTEHPPNDMCLIHIFPANEYPKIALYDYNVIIVCVDCVVQALQNIKKYEEKIIEIPNIIPKKIRECVSKCIEMLGE